MKFPTFKRAQSPPYILGFPMNLIFIWGVPVLLTVTILFSMIYSGTNTLAVLGGLIMGIALNAYLFFFLKKKGRRVVIEYYLKYFNSVKQFSNKKATIKRVSSTWSK